MKFEYKDFGFDDKGQAVVRPVIPVVLRALDNGGRRVRYEALIDSGADLCLFPTGLADALGIELTRGEVMEFVGASGAPTAMYTHRVQIQVGEWFEYIPVGFAEIPPLGYGLLGQRGFFEYLNVKFKHKAREIEITRSR